MTTLLGKYFQTNKVELLHIRRKLNRLLVTSTALQGQVVKQISPKDRTFAIIYSLRRVYSYTSSISSFVVCLTCFWPFNIVRQAEHHHSYVLQLTHDYRKLEDEIKKTRKQKNDLERSHDRAMKEITHNSKDLVIETLKDDIQRLQEDRDDKEKQIAELKAAINQYQTKYDLLRNISIDK